MLTLCCISLVHQPWFIQVLQHLRFQDALDLPFSLALNIIKMLSSSPEQSKELTLHQRLGPPVDIRASRPSRGGSLISWMTEQPPHMSRSSARPGPPLLLLSPPQSHIPTHPHLPHPYLPSCRHSPSSHGYHRHSPLPSSLGPRYCSPSSRYHSPSPHY